MLDQNAEGSKVTENPEGSPRKALQTTPITPGSGDKNTIHPDNGHKSKSGLLFSLIGLFFFLFSLFIVFLVLMLLQNGGDNPLLGALGVEPALLQQLLTTLVSLVFGFLSLVSFVIFLLGVFRRLTSTPIEVQKKKRSLILAILSFVFFLFFIFVWIILYFYITQLQFQRTGKEIILTDPQNTINLTAPVDITFTAREIEKLYFRDGIVSYSWDLDGDGEFDDGNGRDIQYRYDSIGNADGVYQVAVKAILQNGKEVITQHLVTIANVRPVAVFDYAPKILEVPLELTFDASKSFDDDGSVISYDWDFDADGVADTQGVISKWTFTEAKAQSVSLRITDNNGEKVEKSVILDFRQGRVKEAVISVRPGLKGPVPFQVTADASRSFIGDRIQSYEWDFGDGSAFVQGRVVQHRYTDSGEYTLRLTVSGNNGQLYEKEETITVSRSIKPPLAVISVENANVVKGALEGEAPLELQFDASDSVDPDGNIIEYRWDFDGDGEDDAFGVKVTHTFVDDREYIVLLTVVDDDAVSTTAELDLTVNVPDVEVSLEVSPFSGPIPLEVAFDASASRTKEGTIISYVWDFGDGSSEVIGSSRQTYVYNVVGEYTVSVSVLTDKGMRGERDVLIVAREVELQADFTVSPDSILSGQKVFFDAAGSQGQINRYYWEFGDGTISRVVKPDHIYSKPGQYEVLLEIYDRKGRISRKKVGIDVSAQ